jgi:hypothetical protein
MAKIQKRNGFGFYRKELNRIESIPLYFIKRRLKPICVLQIKQAATQAGGFCDY